MLQDRCDLAIIGAGPTGLGAAWRLANPPNNCTAVEWVLLCADQRPGGLAGSVIDPDHFTWDLGGHVICPHYPLFDQLLDKLISRWVWNVPVRGAWMFQRFIPYPVQKNIRHLPKREMLQCLQGLVEVLQAGRTPPHGCDFREFLEMQFGKGFCEVFFEPLNFKMWAHPLSELNSDWVRHRSGSQTANVATTDLMALLENLVFEKDEPGWTPNTRSRYPATGGTGSIWQALFDSLPTERATLGVSVTHIETKNHVLHLSDGRRLEYQFLISSMPLNHLLTMITDQPELTIQAERFKYSGTYLIGLGLEGPLPKPLEGVCTLYLPELNIPCWRLSVLSNFSPGNVPTPDHWSILTETAESAHKPVNSTSLLVEVRRGLQRCQLLSGEAKEVSVYMRYLPFAYPLPFRERDRVLPPVQAKLKSLNIYSRGRFGGWKYEVSNQDHSFMQGVEAIDHILLGRDETTYDSPFQINA